MELGEALDRVYELANNHAFCNSRDAHMAEEDAGLAYVAEMEKEALNMVHDFIVNHFGEEDDLPTKAFKIENLDVYRRTIAVATKMYAAVRDDQSVVGQRIREEALSATLNLASGLGFWEKKQKVQHFEAAKKNLMNLAVLEKVQVILQVRPDNEELDAELGEITKMVNGLLVQAKRRADEKEDTDGY